MTRALYLDRSPGEARGVVTANGRPERLLIEREGDPTPRLGALYLGRVAAVSARMGLARIDLGVDDAASLKLLAADRLSEGATVEVEVTAEPARDKGAAVKLVRAASAGRPGLLVPAAQILDRLRALAPEADVVQGEEAREQADTAQAQAVSREHALPSGVRLTIEPTRALVAVDVDLSETGAPKGSLNANLAALGHVGRLLRLKALSGLIVIDLIGFPKEAARVYAAAREAFAADGPQVVIAPVSRFGALELSKPRRDQPLHERLLDDSGHLSDRSLAHETARMLEREGRFRPGARLCVVCAPKLASHLRPLVQGLGPRFSVRDEAACERMAAQIVEL